MRRPRGFTLIEMLAVIGIIVLVIGISVPAVGAMMRGNKQAQAQNQVRSYLSFARSTALMRQCQVGVVFFQETADHAMPYHGNQIAMQIFIEEHDQTTTPAKNPKNTLFAPFSKTREYLPAGIAVAALNDVPGKQAINGDSTGGHNLAILFDATGQMVTRHGLARRNLPSNGTAGTYPWAMADWNFASQGTVNSDNSSNGISSPGVFLYDLSAYESQNIASGSAGDLARGAWIKQHANVIVVNANTGGILR